MSTFYYLVSPKHKSYMWFDDITGCCPPYQRARAYMYKLLALAAEFNDIESVDPTLLHITGDAADACKDTSWTGAREAAIRTWLTATQDDFHRYIVSDEDFDHDPLGRPFRLVEGEILLCTLHPFYDGQPG